MKTEGRISPSYQERETNNRAQYMSEFKAKGEGDVQGGGGRMPRRIDDGKLCYTIPEAASLLGISRNNGYELARRGEIPVICFGKRKLVPKVPFHRMLGDYPEGESHIK